LTSLKDTFLALASGGDFFFKQLLVMLSSAGLGICELVASLIEARFYYCH
jgi:hypothetical protein